jgi:hypothetical protein
VLFTTVILALYIEIVIVKVTAPPAPPVPSTITPASYFAAGVADHLRSRIQIVYKFRRNLLREQGNCEHQNKTLQFSMFIINYCIIIINAYYNYIRVGYKVVATML